MKPIFTLYLMAGAIVFAACNADNKSTVEKSSTNQIKTTEAPTQSPATNTETKAVDELCTCFNSFMANMSPRVKRIIIDAGKSGNPVEVLTEELQKLGTEDEQQRLAREFDQFQNSNQLQQCTEDISKKYNLNENDTASRDRVLAAASANKNCEVVYSLMKIGLAQQAQAPLPNRPQ